MMAEFQEVMKQKKRMCKKYTGVGICQSIDYNKCPLKGHELCSKPITLINIDKIQEGEEIIMRWAAEHPEPVYPTWTEYFRMTGVFPAWSGHEILDHTHIPEDIAQELGLEPKEAKA